MYCFANVDLTAEQHCAIRFCVRLQKSADEMVQIMKEAHKDQVFSMSTIYQWYKEFRARISSIDSSWWPTSNYKHWNEWQYCHCCYPGEPVPVCTNTRRIAAYFKNLCSLDTCWEPWNEASVLNVGSTLLDQSTNGAVGCKEWNMWLINECIGVCKI